MPRRRQRPPDGRASNGGVRQPTAGKNYPRRSDLQTQPARTAPNQAYGQATAQREAQQAVPMAGAPTVPPPTAPQPAAPAGPMPGAGGDFMRGTDRPDEPLTAGAPAGLGPGPEVLSMSGRAGTAEDQQDLEALRAYLPQLELMANLPTSSAAARNFVRRIRGAMPPPPG